MSFPTDLFTKTTKSAGDTITSAHYNTFQDELVNVQTKVGINSSAVVTSHDYLLRHLPTQEAAITFGAYDFTVDTNTLFVDASENRVGIGTTSPLTSLHVYNPSDEKARVYVQSNRDGDGEQCAEVLFAGKNDADENMAYVTIVATIKDASDGTEDGEFDIYEYINGKNRNVVNINNTGELRLRDVESVDHGITDIETTWTWCSLEKAGNNGGTAIQGFTSDNIGLVLQSFNATAVNTTKSTTGRGAIELKPYLKSGTGITDCGENANLVIIRNNATTRFLFDAEGSGHADVEWTTYSDGRFKDNRKPIDDGLEVIKLLQPETYYKHSGSLDENDEAVWEEGEGHFQAGFITQDTLVALKDHPEAAKALVRDNGKGSIQEFNYDRVAPYLVDAVIKLDKQIQELNDKISKLEARCQRQ
jgi:hypothetical protein